jgi:membrane protease YdiL (CAAX protease family)
MLMVAFSAFLTRVLIERRGFRDAGWNKGKYQWYLAILFFCALSWLAPALIAWCSNRLQWNWPLSREEQTVAVLSLAGFSLLAGFGEEFGWRGYLLPRWLAEPRYARAVLVAIGLVWGVWHCAIAIGPLLRSTLSGTISWPSSITAFLGSCLQMIGASIALSFIFGALWLKTNSIFLCAFLHGYWIGFRDIVSHFVSFPPIFHSVTLFTVFAAWLISYRWLRKYERCQVLKPFKI